jgi:putative transposase
VLGRKRVFADGEVVATVRDMLSAAMEHHGCSILAYCFMPDHAHVVVRGRDAEADAWAGMVRWKGVSGRWLTKNTCARWQKDFYDSVLIVPEAVQGEIEYVLLNPVRNKMVSDWWDYPYSWRCE